MSRNKTYIDPLFHKPEEVVDFSWLNEVASSNPVDIPNGGYAKQLSGMGATVQIEVISTANILPTVDNMTIVSQTVKTKSDGNHTVDVIVEVPDFVEVISYEVRITKA